MGTSLNKRDCSLDAIRIFACVLIVLMHSPLPSSDAGDGLLLCGLSYVTAPGIGLFFMVSGALLLKPKESLDTFAFLKNRIVKVAVPLVFWSIVGIGLDMCGMNNAELGVLWFLYCIMGLYLLTPILVRWLEKASVREVEFYLLVWFVSLCVPIVKLVYPVSLNTESWLFYFQGYVGYYVLGSYMAKYYKSGKSWIRNHWLLSAVIGCMFVLGVPLAALWLSNEVDFYSLFWYLSATVAMQSLFLWIAIGTVSMLWFRQPSEKLTAISNLCFGVYLIHILVMRNMLWKLHWMSLMPTAVQTVVCAGMTFAVSLLISWCLSKVKYLNRVIGC